MVSAAKETRGRFGRRIALALGATLGIIFVATVINLIGIRLVGSVGAWNEWLDQHQEHLLSWRLCLYGVLAYTWWRMRRRFRFEDDGTDSLIRIRRVEIAAVCTIGVLESMTWFQHS